MIRGKLAYVAFSIVISSLVISGCISQQPAGTPAPTVVPTPTVTTIPAPTQQPGTSVEVLSAPETAVLGKSFDVAWRVNSLQVKTIPHTAVHYGPKSQNEPLTLTSYPNLTPIQNGTIPANFSAKITLNLTGITYFRAHAIIDGVSYWSPEQIITVSALPPTITVTSIPGRAVENTNFTIKWSVSGGIGDISKTEIIWDYKKGNATINDYSHYTSSLTGKSPLEFSETLKVPQSSTIYFRAYAIVDGIEIYSSEYEMTIYPQVESGY